MRAALARHDALAAPARSAHTAAMCSRAVGDAFCAAFPTASDAMAAALEAQRALHLERWPEAGEAPRADGAAYGRRRSARRRLLRRRRSIASRGCWRRVTAARRCCRSRRTICAATTCRRSRASSRSASTASRTSRAAKRCSSCAIPDLPQSFPPLKSQSRAARTRKRRRSRCCPFVNMSTRRGERVFRRRPRRRTAERPREDPRAARRLAHLGVLRSRARTSTSRPSRRSSTSPPSSKAASASPASACASPRS